MNNAIIDTNLLFAIVGALGAFLIWTGLTYREKKAEQTDLDRVSALLDADKLSYKQQNFIKTARKYGLETAIGQANLNVSKAVFIRDGMIIMAVLMAAGWIASNNFVVMLTLGGISWFAYIMWLFERRDKQGLEYEEALADMADRMASGAAIHTVIRDTLDHAIRMAPAIVKTDFELILTNLNQGAKFDEAIQEVKKKRHSTSLNLLLDTLETWEYKGSAVPLADVLHPLTETIRSHMRARQKVNADLQTQKSTLYIITASPFVFMIAMRLFFPDSREAYQTPLGTFFLIPVLLGMILKGSFLTVALLATGAAVFGFITPDRKIVSATNARKKTIQREMGFGLEQISLMLTSGEQLEKALSSAKKTGEFGQICEHIAFGKATNRTIVDIIDEIKEELPEISVLNEFLELVRMESKGQNLVEPFRVMAMLQRDRLENEIIEAGGKAKVTVTMLTSAFVMMSSLFVLIGPIFIIMQNTGF